MNFSFRRKSKISSVFVTSKAYYTCVLEVYDFFHNSGAFFTGGGQMKEPALRRSATVISTKLTS